MNAHPKRWFQATYLSSNGEENGQRLIIQSERPDASLIRQTYRRALKESLARNNVFAFRLSSKKRHLMLTTYLGTKVYSRAQLVEMDGKQQQAIHFMPQIINDMRECGTEYAVFARDQKLHPIIMWEEVYDAHTKKKIPRYSQHSALEN